MEALVAIVCGAVCGLAAAAPLFVLLRRGGDDLARGFGAVMGAFLVVQAALFVVNARWPVALVPFGAAAVLAFLAAVVAGVLRHH